jgi:hypothetical protein
MVYFQTKNPNFGKKIFMGLAMEEVGLFYGHLKTFSDFFPGDRDALCRSADF